MTGSSPNACRGEIHTLTLPSRALSREMTVRVVTPPGATNDLPVLIFLHPWGLSPRYILEKLRLPVYLWREIARGALPPFVVALPEGGKSFYVNALDPPGRDWSALVASAPDFYAGALEQYGRYGDYLWDEVIPAVEKRFCVRKDRAGRAIGGVSMGGAAAAYHAFRTPEAFYAVGMHSPAVFKPPPEQGGPPWIFGTAPDSFAEFNPADLAARLSPDTQPRIWLDCSDEDPLLENVQALHRALDAHALAHEFGIYPGGHNKLYWEPRMADYLAFYAQGWRGAGG